jgi:DNA-binding CsgD family transcriptional regulator/tetratricopeptide (TPR) repeat protein
MILLEREPLIDILQKQLGNTHRSLGHVVCLFGDAGVGKTALLHQFVQTTQSRILWGACEDLTTPEALGPLRDWARDSGHAAFARMPRSGLRIQLFSDILQALSAVHTIAVIEDLHWADGATLDLVRYLGRRIARKPILLIVTARNEDSAARARLRMALGQIPSAQMTYIDVPNLTAEAVEKLAKIGGMDGKRVYQLSGGNAFFVTEILRAGDALPATVREAVLARFDHFSETCQRAIQTISAFPRRAEIWAVKQVCPKECDEIGRAVLAGLIIEADGVYAFRHEIARQAVESTIAFDQRRDINRSILSVLQSEPSVATSRLVHHAQAAGETSSVAALAPVAAEVASLAGAHHEAARHYGMAITAVPNADTRMRAHLLEKYAFELHLVGKLDAALGAYESALEHNRIAKNRLAEGNNLRWMSRVNYLSGNRLLATQYARDALLVLEAETPGAELAMAYSNLGQLSMLEDDPIQTLRWSEKAVALATQIDRKDIISHALNNSGAAQRWTDKTAARDKLDRSLTIALENDFPDHVARNYTNRAYVEINWLENANAHRFLKAGLSYCDERDLGTWHTYLMGCRAQLLLKEGKWDEAATIAQNEILADHATPMLRFPAATALARVRMRRGDPSVADLLEMLSAYIETGNEPPRFLLYVSIRAEHAWIEGSADKNLHKLITQAVLLASQTGDIWTSGELWFWGQKLDVAGLPELPMALPYQQMAAGHWEKSAATWSELDSPYDRALVLMSGDQPAQHEGLACLDDLGAKAVANRFRWTMRQKGLRAIPRGPQRATLSNPSGLTRRQMTVLGLLAEGLSNADIGNRLFVSTKTVDHHVSAILAKLDVRTRGQAVAAARATKLI